jgi:predicted xylose isomerase-like sugar epimerase
MGPTRFRCSRKTYTTHLNPREKYIPDLTSGVHVTQVRAAAALSATLYAVEPGMRVFGNITQTNV